VISFQADCWDDPEKLFGSQGFRLSEDLESQVAVFFADAEPKDLLQIEGAAAAIVRRSNLNADGPRPVHPFFKTSAGGLGRREEQGKFTSGEFLQANQAGKSRS
jgi:hypothetical protein